MFLVLLPHASSSDEQPHSPAAKLKNISSFHTASACLTCSWELPYVLISRHCVLKAVFTKVCYGLLIQVQGYSFQTESSGCLWISLLMEQYIILNWNQRLPPCSDAFAHVFQLLLKLKYTWNIFLTSPASETSQTNGITLADVMLLFSLESTSKTPPLNIPGEIQW